MYSFLKNKEGELMLIFNPSLGEAPELSMFLYDDSGTGLLLQDLFSGIRVKNISPETLAALDDVTHIHVVEKDGETITRDYLSVVKKVSDVRSMVL
ncbi:MAG: hypothetical protein II824_01465 [Bacteroidales bacterium]|nr:hypothetical protein [Bacteroidales bacterium]